jgi:hypothetical protein
MTRNHCNAALGNSVLNPMQDDNFYPVYEWKWKYGSSYNPEQFEIRQCKEFVLHEFYNALGVLVRVVLLCIEHVMLVEQFELFRTLFIIL